MTDTDDNQSNSFVVALLKSEFDRRAKKIAKYSLRKFSADLGCSHTLLSLILNGKRSVSTKLLESIMSSSNLSSDLLTSLEAHIMVTKMSHTLRNRDWTMESEHRFWGSVTALLILKLNEEWPTPELLSSVLKIEPRAAMRILTNLSNF